MTQSMKRIHKVVIKRMIDSDPDTSWLGEYSNTKTSEFSIDRKHSFDCRSVNSQSALDQLERVLNYIFAERQKFSSNRDSDAPLYDAFDEAADLIGEKQDELQECDCNESGDMNRNEYRYFNPSFNYVSSDGKIQDGLTPEDVRKYTRSDYERMEALNNQQWGFIGIKAEAQVQLSSDVVQRITSGGLWGVESDSGKEYFAEVEAEELATLATELHALGFSKRAVSAAFRNVEHKEA